MGCRALRYVGPLFFIRMIVFLFSVMRWKMTRSELFAQLSNAGINLRPDDGCAISAIEKYICDLELGGNDNDKRKVSCGAAVAELCRRMSELECDASDASKEAEQACESIIRSIAAAKSLTETQVDEWGGRGLLRDFVFSYTKPELGYAVDSFVVFCQKIDAVMREMSKYAGSAAATAERVSECTSCALSLSSEFKYASYAVRLVGELADGENFFDMSKRARKIGEATDKLSAKLRRAMHALSLTLTALSSAVTNASTALGIADAEIEDDNYGNTAKLELKGGGGCSAIDPKRAAAVLSSAIAAIRAICKTAPHAEDEF